MATSAPHACIDLLGETVGSGYRLVAILDDAGLGLAYRAWDHTADRYVVVKFLRFTLPANTLTRNVEQTVFRVGETIDNLAPGLDHGRHGTLPYIVSPYFAGGTLRQRQPTDQGRPLLAHPALLFAWLPSVATALDALHEQGELHGSVSSDTIIFDHASKPWLTDFRCRSLLQAADAVYGTESALASCQANGRFRYHCPQRLVGLPASRASDQYALAVIVYEYLCGVLPFTGDTPTTLAAAHASHSVVSVRQLSPSLPESLSAAVQRGLTHNPNDRFASCTDFARAVLADVSMVEISRKLRLLCPVCRTLVAIEPAAAGRAGACQACQAPIVVDQDLRWLERPSDRRADLPVEGADTNRPKKPRNWIPVAMGCLAATAALVMVAVRNPEPLPPPGESNAQPAAEPAPPKIAAPVQAQETDEAAEDAINVAGPDAAAQAADEEPTPHAPEPPAPPAAPPALAAIPGPPPAGPQPVPAPPPAAAQRPRVEPVEVAKVRHALETLHATRKELIAFRAEQQAKKVLHKNEWDKLAQEAITNPRQQAAIETAIVELKAQLSVAVQPARVQQLRFEIALRENDLQQLSVRRPLIEDEQLAAKAAFESAEAQLQRNASEGDNLRKQWISELNALERDEYVATRIEILSNDMLVSPDFNEAHLYRALLHILVGDAEAAQRDLELFDRSLIDGPDPVQVLYAIDFVYAQIMLGNTAAAREGLLHAEKHHPNDPIVQHIRGLCEIASNDFSEAASLLKTAIRRQSNTRLKAQACSDAAWLLAAAPSDSVRNPKLAGDYAEEALHLTNGRSWQAWRARAAVLAELGRWQEANTDLDRAKQTAPLIVKKQLQEQGDAIAAQQPYRFARMKKR